ncbi:MAG: family 16 glycoside hydrolase, partial [Planctomycetota bacterium]
MISLTFRVGCSWKHLPMHAAFGMLVILLAAVPSRRLRAQPTSAASSGHGLSNQLSEAEKKSGWQLLFDGHSLDGWKTYNRPGKPSGWLVRDGAIVRAPEGGGDLITKKKYEWFEVCLEYKISEGGNSGLLFHVVEGGAKPWHSGPEIQVIDNAKTGIRQKSGWLYELYEPVAPKWVVDKSEVDATRPAGQWNQIYLRVLKDNCEVCVNGLLYYRFKIGSKDWKERVAKSKFAKFAKFGTAGEGHLCLQDHGDDVAFRNVKLRVIEEDGTVPQPVDGDLNMATTLAFPNLVWDEWEPFDDSGSVRPLRLMELTYPDDQSGRLFAASQQGAIWAFENREDVSDSTMFLDLRGKVLDWKTRGSNEQGLLGVAFHPEYKDNGYFYVYYTHPTE